MAWLVTRPRASWRGTVSSASACAEVLISSKAAGISRSGGMAPVPDLILYQCDIQRWLNHSYERAGAFRWRLHDTLRGNLTPCGMLAQAASIAQRKHGTEKAWN